MAESLKSNPRKRKIDSKVSSTQLKISEERNQKPYQNNLKAAEERLAHIRKEKLHSDCQFEVGGKIFDAHKLILSLSSPVFETMFYGSLAENTNKPIEIADLSSEIFELLLVYIYENKFEVNSIELAKNVMYASQKYMIDSLQEKCKSYVKNSLKGPNAIEAYEFATIFQDPELQASSLMVIINNSSTALSSCNYENISIDTFLVVSKQERLSLASELPLFNALAKFVEKNENADSATNGGQGCAESGSSGSGFFDQQKVREALKTIRFLAMTPKEFVSGPSKSKLLLPNEKLAILSKLVSPADTSLEYPIDFCKESNLRKLNTHYGWDSSSSDSEYYY